MFGSTSGLARAVAGGLVLAEQFERTDGVELDVQRIDSAAVLRIRRPVPERLDERC